MSGSDGVVQTTLTFFGAYWLLTLVHEVLHIIVACLLGYAGSALTVNNFWSATCSKHVSVPGVSGWRSDFIRHAGWVGSMLLALSVSWSRVYSLLWAHSCKSDASEDPFFCPHSKSGILSAVQAAAVLSALDSACSDLLGLGDGRTDKFCCGNFGLVLIKRENCGKVVGILREMVRVTMMRGAQSGGVVTYITKGIKGFFGIRSRVVNGKRTDLSELVANKLTEDQGWYKLYDGPRIYAGHTRFATTSKATMDGTHPHQWTPPQQLDVWRRTIDGAWIPRKTNVENFICHNGDLDSFDVSKVTFPLEVLMPWLERINHSPCPSSVDSCGVAGLIDLLRCQGSWYKAVKFGYVFGIKRRTLDYKVPSKAEFQHAAMVFDHKFRESLKEGFEPREGMTVEDANALFKAFKDPPTISYEDVIKHYMRKYGKHMSKQAVLTRAFHEVLVHDVNGDGDFSRGELYAYDPQLRNCVITLMRDEVGLFGLNEEDMSDLIETAVVAFFDQDLIQAVRMFLKNAKGSFGLCVNSSLDAHRQIVVAARGQTISVAMYPQSGTILWASEQAACKAGIHAFHEDDSTLAGRACRLDLDDLGGEICLIDWGKGPASYVPGSKELESCSIMNGEATLLLAQEEVGLNKPFQKRVIDIVGNPLVKPLPMVQPDPVLTDINEIPSAIHSISASMETENAMTSYCFGKELLKRLRMYEDGTHDGSIDILLTGCEVSLWVCEQFAADLHLVMPRLSIKVVSSNKLLGQLGQELPIPQIGHQFHEKSWRLEDSICIIASHSGGTFGPLAVSNLLQGFTKTIFVITSEWDTQIGKQLRLMTGSAWEFKSPIFSTNIGMRPAEPCTISVVATHQMFTELLLYIMKKVHFAGAEHMAHATFGQEHIQILDDINNRNVGALEEIIGINRLGGGRPTSTSTELREMGLYWSQHVLEGVYSWILVFCYISATVISGYPLVSGIASAVKPEISRNSSTQLYTFLAYLFAVVDAVIYVFSPQWCCLLLRVYQRRPLLHRMTARSVVVGDIPWVSQSVEAYLSKLFACAYSAAGITVYAGNPNDHLVHRLTHRVVRGGLLVCGRPDGRLVSLTTSESSACLSTCQASSIISIGSTMESITIGHNPAPVSLCKKNFFLKSHRKEFYCERALKLELGVSNLDGRSSGMLLGDYSNLKKRCLGILGHKKGEDVTEMLASMSSHKRKISQDEMDQRRREKAKFKVGDKKGKEQLASFPGKRKAKEVCYGDELAKELKDGGQHDFEIAEKQQLAMMLYESRFASMQRAVAMFVMFHALAKQVQDFWPSWTFGYLGYDMSRTHSIMRIATTASPVSGAEVRDRTLELAKKTRLKMSLGIINRSICKRRQHVRDYAREHLMTSPNLASPLQRQASYTSLSQSNSTINFNQQNGTSRTDTF